MWTHHRSINNAVALNLLAIRKCKRLRQIGESRQPLQPEVEVDRRLIPILITAAPRLISEPNHRVPYLLWAPTAPDRFMQTNSRS